MNFSKVEEGEKAVYSAIDFDPEEYKKDVGVSGKLMKETKEELLMNRWRFPSLSLHGIEGLCNLPSSTCLPHLTYIYHNFARSEKF